MHQLPLLTPRPPSALSRLTIALALVLGAALAWAVVAELRFQRRTTEKVSEDYLSLLARERVDAAASALRSAIAGELGSQVGGTMGSVYEELPPPAPRGNARTPLGCDGAGDDTGGASPTYFRMDLRDLGFLTAPPARAGEIAWVRDSIAAAMRTSPLPAGTYQSLATPGGVAVYGVKYAPYNAPVAVYGLVTCARAIGVIVAGAHARGAADSLIVVEAVAGRDTLVRHVPASTRALARGEVAGVRLAAYPAFSRPLAGIVIERDGVPSVALTLMLLGTFALASIAVLQLVRDRRAVRRQAELLTTISHELRTPLAQILLYSETLALDRVRGDDAKRAAAQRIVDEARRLIETVSNVVGLTRQERAASSVTPVGPVIESAITRVRALSDARARVVVTVSGAPRVRLGDSALLQALTNVLDNALKFGSASQTVMVSAARSGPLVRITVEDEGPGIPQAVRHRIWNKYFRANGATDASGAGIGLWIVRDIVVRAGGRVHADDAAKGGARVVIELPAADDA